ncbi:MAG: type 4a pilus biogenesis protein PilO [Patescibacteria group bacterium]
MKLPTHYFEDLSARRYREYLKLLPDFHKENTKLLTMLIFTFLAMSFFGIFAINPTLTTIVELQKQLQDSEFTVEQLRTKINNLSSLQQQYAQIESDLSLVSAAIPENADVPIATGQIRALAKEHKITITNLRVNEVLLASPKLHDAQIASFVFTMEASGAYEDMMQFSNALTKLRRIITIDSLAIGKDTQSNNLLLQIRGREYFKK